jgi:hypothetical protein
VTFFAGCHCPLCSRSAGLSLMLQRADHSSPKLSLIKWSVLLFRTPGYQGSLMAFPSLAPQIMRRLITTWPLPAIGFLVCHIIAHSRLDGPYRQIAQCKKRIKTGNKGHVYVFRCKETLCSKGSLWLTFSVSKCISFRVSLIHSTSSLRP